jgi:hypothetical protein
MQRNVRDEARLLKHTKSYAPSIVKRKPSPSEGSEGDIAFGNTPDGIKLFAKLGNKWYTFSADKENETVSTYRISNLSVDRTYNANSTSTTELADIIGTLIKDLEELGFLKSAIT